MSNQSNPRPHVVILGAGASRAAFPNGDKNSKELPLMCDLIEMLKLDNLLQDIPKNLDNFEAIYSQIAADSQYESVKEKLELSVYDYFSDLVITDEPTIYDKLILSLTKSDVIATFNWDPLLTQAYLRNFKLIKDLPGIIFLHGNVAQGYCEKCDIIGVNKNACIKCKNAYKPTKLLYPIDNKNYSKDKFIKTQWREFKEHLEEAIILTIFGYGAPTSDTEAIKIMQSAWRTRKRAKYIEIIDINNNVNNNWSKFREVDSTLENPISEHHKEFKDSWISNHPRNTCLEYIRKYWCGEPINNNPIPENLSLSGLQNWIKNI